MRTKALLFTAALGLVGVSAASAQSVYSVNAVGYVNVSLPIGYSIISNPLNGTNNNLSTILPNVPNNTAVYKFDPATQGFSTASVFFVDEGVGIWFPDNVLNPGEGAFIQLTEAATVTFVGEVPQGNLTNTIPANFSLRASQVPQSAALTTTLGFPAQNGDTVFFWNRNTQQYAPALSYFVDEGVGVWFPSEPVPGVAEGFFIQNTTGLLRSWTRSFSVN
jgi:hypothetical protein